ncbi:hypothetical protein CHISP_0687 [Chitinispirillum alkaliphilum]|nr:hypothetical protein CHISP_0687 [Chitinispirillum alkaliphilum]
MIKTRPVSYVKIQSGLQGRAINAALESTKLFSETFFPHLRILRQNKVGCHSVWRI